MTFSLYDGFMFWQEFYEKIDADLISVLLASKMQNNKERGHTNISHINDRSGLLRSTWILGLKSRKWWIIRNINNFQKQHE